MNEETKKNHNRAVTLMVFAMIVASFISMNAKEFLLPSALYILISIISIVLYFVWWKF